MTTHINEIYLLSQLSPYGAEDGRMSPSSAHSSPVSSPVHSPTLASLHTSGGHIYGSPGGYGLSPRTSPSPNASMVVPGDSLNMGEPPSKLFPQVAFEDLSASFKNLYKSVFDASHSGGHYGGRCSKVTCYISVEF